LLADRIDKARARAVVTTRRSAMLRAASGARRAGGFTTVCAWCGAFGIGAEFFEPGSEPAFATRAEITHGICPSCLDNLRRTGKSR